MVHHENRTGKPRGTSKREDVLDTMIGLRKVTDESAEEDSTFQLTFTKSRDFYGKDSEPMLVRLSMKEGRVAWTYETVRDARKEKIAELLAGGWKQTDIAKELHLTKGRVNQIAQTMKHEEITAKFPPPASRAVRREKV